jgi:hypothetical protein
LLSSPKLLIYNVASQNEYSDSQQEKPFYKHIIWFSSDSRSVKFDAIVNSYSCVSPKCANSLTNAEPFGIITITAQQLKELENSMSDIRQALEQRNTTQALLNLTILEGQISVLAEDT